MILDACCGGRMFWYNKKRSNTVYMDNRVINKGSFPNNWNPNWCVKPDVIADFRHMPYQNNIFDLIVYDPPHLYHGTMKSVINKKYGLLNKDTWKKDLVNGFNECWRVLKNGGCLIFKWCESDIKTSEIIKVLPVNPLFGDLTGKTGKSIWMTFYKDQPSEGE